jgi:hypothetical protein
MATYYLDLISGNDSNSGLAWDLPKLTFAAVNTAATANDEVRIAKTTASSSIAGANYTWTANNATIATSADVRASIAAGDYIGTTGAAGNGSAETYFCVASTTASSITLVTVYNGTTKTEASVLKLNPLTTTITATKALVVSGGWTLAASPTRDSETWLKTTGTGTNGVVFVANCAFSYLNSVGTSTVAQFTGALTATCQYCTAISVAKTTGGISFNATTLGGNICVVGYNNSITGCSTSGSCLVVGAGNIGYYNGTCGTTSTAYGCVNGFSTCTLAGTCVAVNCPTGINTGCTNSGRPTVTATGCTLGFNGYSCVGLCTANTCTTGFDTCSPLIGSVANACGIGFNTCTVMIGTASNNCTSYGVLLGGTFDGYYQGHTSTSDVVGFAASTGRCAGTLVGCNIVTPVNWGISQPLNCQGVKCIGCTIDTPSLAKAYLITTGANYSNPRYYLQNSFGKTGQIFTNASLVQDMTTTPYSMQLVFSGTSGLQVVPLKIASLYVKIAVAISVSVQYWAPTGSWSGTIVPLLRLNGRTIATGTTLASITSTPSTLTFNVTSEMITSDGELSIELVPNCNNIATNWASLVVAKT